MVVLGGGAVSYERGTPVIKKKVWGLPDVYPDGAGVRLHKLLVQLFDLPPPMVKSQRSPPESLHAPAKFTSVSCLNLKGPYDGLPPLSSVKSQRSRRSNREGVHWSNRNGLIGLFFFFITLKPRVE